jgi:hypothetical protein
MDKKFLTEKELAARWNLLPKTLRQWRWHKKGPRYTKIGGNISYKTQNIEKYEEDHEISIIEDTNESQDNSG